MPSSYPHEDVILVKGKIVLMQLGERYMVALEGYGRRVTNWGSEWL